MMLYCAVFLLLFFLSQVSTNGYISFEKSFSQSFPCQFPCTPSPTIASAWTFWTFLGAGSIYYRVAQDQATLEQVVQTIAATNPGLSVYQPTLALIVTWFEANNLFLRVSVIDLPRSPLITLCCACAKQGLCDRSVR